MFNPIITNAPTKAIRAYNKLITQKPKGNMTLAAKVQAQREWRDQCVALLNTFITEAK